MLRSCLFGWMFVIVMGVSGCGKSSIGRLLAEKLSLSFYDADDYHSEGNIEKMSGGKALEDEDRQGWLNSLQEMILEKKSGVLACSALKEAYRDHLRRGGLIRFVYLYGERELLRQRLEQRSNHFMSVHLLDSQLAILEEPEDAIFLNISLSPEEIAKRAADSIKGLPHQ